MPTRRRAALAQREILENSRHSLHASGPAGSFDRCSSVNSGTARKQGLSAFRHSSLRAVRHPRGLPAASLKRPRHVIQHAIDPQSSAGITRGLIEAPSAPASFHPPNTSSAGITRGLIEAHRRRRWSPPGIPRHPRGLPAASLKLFSLIGQNRRLPGHPRGLPAASLKRSIRKGSGTGRFMSSAGITRGLIEAASDS